MSSSIDAKNLPLHWEIKKLIEITEIITCGVAKRPNYVTDGIPFLSAKNVKNGQIIWDDYKYVSPETHAELTKNNKPEKGDILYTRVGSFGEAAIIDRDDEFSIFVSLTLIKTKDTILNSFLKYYLNSDAVKTLAKKSINGVGVGNLNVGTVRKFPVPIPPLSEQKEIVEKLDKAFEGIDRAIANTEKNLANARELFDNHLDKNFVEKTKKWERDKLGNLCERITKGSSPKWQGLQYVNQPGVLFITSENIGFNKMIFRTDKYVENAFNKTQRKSILKKGDVLTNIVGASIGRTSIFDQEEIANINQAVCLLRCSPNLLFNKYLCYLLNSRFFRVILHNNEINTARANLSLTFFKNLEIPVPPINDQKIIVDQTEKIFIKTQRLEAIYQQKLQALQELKQSILHKAFTGELTNSTVKDIAA